MFGINLGEFGVIALVALIVIGPERLPRYAQQLGRAAREARKMALGMREQVRGELGPEFDEVDWRKLDPRQYDPRRIIRDALLDPSEDDPEPLKPPSAGGPTAQPPTAPSTPETATAAPGGAEHPAPPSATGTPAPGPARYDSEAT